MLICRHCLEAVESREGRTRYVNYPDVPDGEIVYGYYTSDWEFKESEFGEEHFECEWCHDMCYVGEAVEIWD